MRKGGVFEGLDLGGRGVCVWVLIDLFLGWLT